MYENRIYIPEPTPITDRPMTKYLAPKGEGFGTRLAQLRKTAGYTQEQLASELGISRRRIAYYEAESDHPPVGFLGDLARVLNTTTDELLGHGAGKAKTAIEHGPAFATGNECADVIIKDQPTYESGD